MCTKHTAQHVKSSRIYSVLRFHIPEKQYASHTCPQTHSTKHPENMLSAYAHARSIMRAQSYMQLGEFIMENSSQKRHGRFNPPLKKDTSSLSESCSSIASWNLPPTQTHTVLSYCDADPKICETVGEQEHAAVEHKSLEHKSLERTKRNYNYSTVPMAKVNARPRKVSQKFSSAAIAIGTNVYDYSLTPSEQLVKQERHRKTRNKEQVRNHFMHIIIWPHVAIFCRLKLTRLLFAT